MESENAFDRNVGSVEVMKEGAATRDASSGNDRWEEKAR